MTTLGASLLVTGMLANRWLIGLVLCDDGRVDDPLLGAMILVVQAGLVGAGAIVFVWGRNAARGRCAALNSALVLVSVGACLGLGEVFLRIHTGATDRYCIPLFRDDGGQRFRLRPMLRETVNLGDSRIPVHTNSIGLRWREVRIENPNSKTRIAFVGDSFTFGEWADIEDSFAGVFDSLLDRRHYEVLNFGTPSYGLLEVRQQMQEDVLQYHPAYVFLVFYSGNDVADTFLGPNRYRIANGVAVLDSAKLRRDFPQIFAPGEASAGPPHNASSLAERVLGHSRLYALLRRSCSSHVEREHSGRVAPSVSFMSFTFWGRRSYPEVGRAAIDTTLAVLEDIARICMRNRVQLVIAAMPFKEQVHAADTLSSDFDIGLPQRYIARFANGRSIPYLDLLPILRAHARGDGDVLYVSLDPHLNANGHRIVGVALAEFFRSIVASEHL